MRKSIEDFVKIHCVDRAIYDHDMELSINAGRAVTVRELSDMLWDFDSDTAGVADLTYQAAREMVALGATEEDILALVMP